MHRVHTDLDTVTADILVLKLRCVKRSAYIERPSPHSSKRRPHFEIRACPGENILFMDFKEAEVRNNSAGEGQQ
jgi:hypothetical protein